MSHGRQWSSNIKTEFCSFFCFAHHHDMQNNHLSVIFISNKNDKPNYVSIFVFLSLDSVYQMPMPKIFVTFGKSNYKPKCQRLWNVSNAHLDLLIFLITQMPRDYCRKWKGLEFINLNLCHFWNQLIPWCYFSWGSN